jgi:hypothetical protein
VKRRRTTYHLTQAECDRLKQLCTVHTRQDAAAIVGCCPDAVTHAAQRGWKAFSMPQRPRPSDFALRAHIMTKKQLRRHYVASQACVIRWSAEIGRQNMPKKGGVKPLPIPADFLAVTEQLGSTQAVADHYGVHRSTVKGWRKKSGLVRPRKAKPVSMVGWVDSFAAKRRAQSRSTAGECHVRTA